MYYILFTYVKFKYFFQTRCDKCEFATALKRNLERHHVRVHSHIKPYSCPMQGCGYQVLCSTTDYYYPKHFEIYVRYSSGQFRRKLNCPDIPNQFSTIFISSRK